MRVVTARALRPVDHACVPEIDLRFPRNHPTGPRTTVGTVRLSRTKRLLAVETSTTTKEERQIGPDLFFGDPEQRPAVGNHVRDREIRKEGEIYATRQN